MTKFTMKSLINKMNLNMQVEFNLLLRFHGDSVKKLNKKIEKLTNEKDNLKEKLNLAQSRLKGNEMVFSLHSNEMAKLGTEISLQMEKLIEASANNFFSHPIIKSRCKLISNLMDDRVKYFKQIALENVNVLRIDATNLESYLNSSNESLSDLSKLEIDKDLEEFKVSNDDTIDSVMKLNSQEQVQIIVNGINGMKSSGKKKPGPKSGKRKSTDETDEEYLPTTKKNKRNYTRKSQERTSKLSPKDNGIIKKTHTRKNSKSLDQNQDSSKKESNQNESNPISLPDKPTQDDETLLMDLNTNEHEPSVSCIINLNELEVNDFQYYETNKILIFNNECENTEISVNAIL